MSVVFSFVLCMSYNVMAVIYFSTYFNKWLLLLFIYFFFFFLQLRFSTDNNNNNDIRENIAHKFSGKWIRNGFLKKETEGMLFAQLRSRH